MAAVSNIVELVFKIADQASGPASKVEGHLKSITDSANSARNAVAMVGGALGALGVGAAIKKIVDISNEWEQTTTRIAGNLQSMGVGTDFNTTLRTSEMLMNSIYEKAAKLPGDAEQYITVFAQNIPQITAAGMTNMMDMVDFVSSYTAFTTTQQIDAAQAASDLQLMLSGRTGMMVRSWSSALKNLVDQHYASTEAFNNLSAPERLRQIMDALKKTTDAQAKAMDSYDSKVGEVVSKFRILVHTASQPLFENLKGVMDSISQFLTENQEQITQVVMLLGYGLVAAINMVKPAMQWLLNHLKLIAQAAAVFAGVWTGAQLGAIIGGMMKMLRYMKMLYDMSKAFTILEVVKMVVQDFAGKPGGLGLLMGAGKGLLVGGIVTALVSKVNAEFADIEDKMSKFRVDENLFSPVMEMPKMAQEMPDFMAEMLKKAGKWKPPKGPPKTEINFNNARFDIRQNYAEGYDPDRIAAAFVDGIGNATMFRTQAALGAGMPGTGG